MKKVRIRIRGRKKGHMWMAVTSILAVFTDSVAPTAAKAADIPNVVLILPDNLRYGDIGAFHGGRNEDK